MSLEVEINCRYNWKEDGDLTLESIFRNGNGHYVFRWADRNGDIRVIEYCDPQTTSFFYEEGGW